MVDCNDLRAVGHLLELKRPGLLLESKRQSWTLGHFVAAFGTEVHLIHLLRQCPSFIYGKTADGKTMFDLAVQYNNVSTTTVLLHFYALL